MRLPLKLLAKVACVVREVVNPTQAVVVAVSCVVIVTASVLPAPCFLIEAGQRSTKYPSALLFISVIVSSVNGLSAVTFTATSTPLAPSAHTVLPAIVPPPIQSDSKVSVGVPVQLVVILATSRLEYIVGCAAINANHSSTLFTG